MIESLESRMMLSLATSLIDQINLDRIDPVAARARVGVSYPIGFPTDPRPSLRSDPDLTTSAQAWADKLAATGVLSHDFDGTTPTSRTESVNPSVFYDVENAGLMAPIWSTDEASLTSRALRLHDLFVGENGHFAQLEDPGTRLVGIGTAIGTYNGVPAFWLVVEMGVKTPSIADANNDGIVNTLDFDVLASNFNEAMPAAALPPGDYTPIVYGWERGDFNGDGRVNALDFNALASSLA